MRSCEYEIVNARLWIRDYEIVNARLWMRDWECEIVNARLWMRKCECETANAKLWMRDCECESVNARLRMQNCECEIVNAKLWMRHWGHNDQLARHSACTTIHCNLAANIVNGQEWFQASHFIHNVNHLVLASDLHGLVSIAIWPQALHFIYLVVNCRCDMNMSF